MKTRLIVVVFAILVLIGSFIPFDTVFVPEWRIKVVDEDGIPYRGKLVRQFCTNYTLGIHPCENANDTMQLTDEDGYVLFPERTINASLASRLAWTCINFVFQFAHGGYGAQRYVDATGPQGIKDLVYDPWKPPPEEFILPSKENKDENNTVSK